MSEWRIVDEPDLDRIGISNPDVGCDVYLPHWSKARIETAHSPPESGIQAELLSCHVTDTWNYSLTHVEVERPGGVCTPAYLLEVWIEYCLVMEVHLPFAFGEKLRQKWLERS